jgi:UDP-glucose 4-epimerase
MALFLVTGGAGFIGSNIVRQLVARGDRVRVFDNLATGRAENLADLPDVELVDGDLRDQNAVRGAVEGTDVVLHQGALPSVPRSVRDPMTSHEVNVTGTLNLLIAARDAGIKRVVCASSSSVYGDTPTLPKVETMTPNPQSPYAATKMACELYCSVFNRMFGVEAVALRYFNVFGPRQDPTSQYAAVIPLFMTSIARGEPPRIHGDGTQSRDFTFIDNVVQANLRAAEAPGVGGQAFNVACGQRYTINELVDSINEILGTDVRPEYGEARPGDVKHSLADIDKARRLLGYEPSVSFREGLERTAAWFVPR